MVSSPLKHVKTHILLKRLWKCYLRQYINVYILAIFCMLIVGASTTALVKLIEPTLDNAFTNKDFVLIKWLAFSFVIISIIRGGANYVQTILLVRVGLKVIIKIQHQMFHSLMQMDLIDVLDQGTASQLSRFSNDVHILRTGVTKVFTGIGRDLSIIIFMTVTMFTLNWQMALGACLFFPVSVWPVIKLGKRMRKITYIAQNELAEMTAVIDDSLKEARQVRAYGLQKRELRRGVANFIKIFRLTLKQTMVRTLTHPIMDTLSGLTIACILLWGGNLIIEGNLTIGQFMTFFLAIGAAYQPARSLANLNTALQETLASTQRIFTLLDMRPSITSKPNAPSIQVQKGAITFKDVSFHYKNGINIFNQLNLTINAQETIALVGTSGGGKSTLINLIPRFFDVSSGQILIDGQDIRDVQLASLRKQIALVSQESSLFNMSIYDNIACGRYHATQKEIEDAAQRAHVDTFIKNCPEGYNTIVGEQGVRLSGGQRQRIVIARALLKNAPILLLDEATSALDNETEHMVQEALETLMQNRTVLVIAHRLSTIRSADRICVIKSGQIVEQGSHEQLIAAGNSYAHLYELQQEQLFEVN